MPLLYSWLRWFARATHDNFVDVLDVLIAMR